MLSTVEKTRLQISQNTAAKRKAQLGQFLTPADTAAFMAGLFPDAKGGDCRLLDAGAGIGSLSYAFLERCASGQLRFDQITLTAFERDESLLQTLEDTVAGFRETLQFSYRIVGNDFIESAVNQIQFAQDTFTHAILNPPYKKINSRSRERLLLRQVGIETVNLYSAFIALTLLLLAPGGQLVAIIPRSFCNGPYYRPFREILLQQAAIHHIHLFESRTSAFKDDDVLQENIIIRLERDGQQASVTVSTSTDDRFADLISYDHAFERIVFPNDPQQFIHIPLSPETRTSSLSAQVRYSLAELGIQVSTGPVVDFRLKEHLRSLPEVGTVPLLYPTHFSGDGMQWPKADSKKPNAIQHNEHTEKWLYPNGFYCVVRRFSSKEEKRRIVASVVDPSCFGDAPVLGFENHLNVFHKNKRGLPEELAYGLAAYLNTTVVDEHFRRFSGHTQVNATDLRLMKYPSVDVLLALGKWTMTNRNPTQAILDEQLAALTG